MKDNFQGQLLENVMNYYNKKGESFDKVLLLTTELLWKIEIIKNNIDKTMKNYLKDKREK